MGIDPKFQNTSFSGDTFGNNSKNSNESVLNRKIQGSNVSELNSTGSTATSTKHAKIQGNIEFLVPKVSSTTSFSTTASGNRQNNHNMRSQTEESIGSIDDKLGNIRLADSTSNSYSFTARNNNHSADVKRNTRFDGGGIISQTILTSRSAPSTPKFLPTAGPSQLSNDISFLDNADGPNPPLNLSSPTSKTANSRIRGQMNSPKSSNKTTVLQQRRYSNNSISNFRMTSSSPVSMSNKSSTIPKRSALSLVPYTGASLGSDSGSLSQTKVGVPLLASYGNLHAQILAPHSPTTNPHAVGASNRAFANYGSINNSIPFDAASVCSDSAIFSQNNSQNRAETQYQGYHRGVLNRIGKKVKNTFYKFNNSLSIHFYEDRIEDIPRQDLLKYYFPIFEWWPDYTVIKFVKDIIAGISLASFQIPLCLSYATSLAHVSPTCGLYGLIVLPLVYFVFGTVPQMIVGPEGAISLVVGQAVEPIMKHNKELSLSDLVVVISAVAGGSLLGAGLLRFGFLENVLNGSLLSGFISGVGLVMIINALLEELKLLESFQKLPGHQHSPVDKIKFIIGNFSDAHIPTVLISAVCFLMIFCTRLLKKKLNKQRFKHLTWFTVFFPEILVTVIIATFISYLMKFDIRYDVDVLGEVSSSGVKFGFPLWKFQKYHMKDFFSILLSAGYVTAILGFFESTTASKSMAMNLDLSVSSDRELIALGMINILGSCFSALPSFGGYGRSKVNYISGAQSTMSGAIMGLVTLLMTLYLLPLIYYLPKCLLSVISMIIGISLLEEAPLNIAYHWRCSGYNEIATFLITITATFFSSIELGITLGCGYSLLRMIKDSSQSRIQLELVDDDSTILVAVPEPLTFTNTEDFRMRLVKLLTEKHDMVMYMVIDLSKMKYIDSSALQILDHSLCKIVRQGKIVRMQVCGAAHLSEKAKSRFESAEFFSFYDVVGLLELVTDARRAISRNWRGGAGDDVCEEEEAEDGFDNGDDAETDDEFNNGIAEEDNTREPNRQSSIGINGAYGDEASLYSRSYLQL